MKLGDKVKCKITGYTGILTSMVNHINGCTRFGIQAPMDKDGKVPECLWVDEPQVEFVEETNITKTSPSTGGPISAPRREATPK